MVKKPFTEKQKNGMEKNLEKFKTMREKTRGINNENAKFIFKMCDDLVKELEEMLSRESL